MNEEHLSFLEDILSAFSDPPTIALQRGEIWISGVGRVTENDYGYHLDGEPVGCGFICVVHEVIDRLTSNLNCQLKSRANQWKWNTGV